MTECYLNEIKPNKYKEDNNYTLKGTCLCTTEEINFNHQQQVKKYCTLR